MILEGVAGEGKRVVEGAFEGRVHAAASRSHGLGPVEIVAREERDFSARRVALRAAEVRLR
jgi:hypothetical protein